MPLDELKVGDSFVVKLVDPVKDKPSISMRLWRFMRSNLGVRLALRTIDDNTVRIFRTEDSEFKGKNAAAKLRQKRRDDYASKLIATRDEI